MLIFPPPKSKGKPKFPPEPKQVPALTLVLARYRLDNLTLTLEFDQPIDIAAFDPSQVTVVDGNYYYARMNGAAPATLTSDTTVVMPVVAGETVEPQTIVLDASATTGLVAQSDGTEWPGGDGLPVHVGN